MTSRFSQRIPAKHENGFVKRFVRHFDSIWQAEEFLADLKREIVNAQGKRDRGAKRHDTNPDWLSKISNYLKVIKQQAQTLERDIAAYKKKARKREADFYFAFYNAAKLLLEHDLFTHISDQAVEQIQEREDE